MGGNTGKLSKRRGRENLRGESADDDSPDNFPLNDIHHNAAPGALQAGFLTTPSSDSFHSPRRNRAAALAEPYEAESNDISEHQLHSPLLGSRYDAPHNSGPGTPQTESIHQPNAVQDDAQPTFLGNTIQNEHLTPSSATAVSINQPVGNIEMDAIPLHKERPLLSAALVTLPVICPLMIVLVIIFKYRVKVKISLFPGSQQVSQLHVLVDFEDTRLMLVASVLNLITPPLGGYIMALYDANIAHRLRMSSLEGRLPLHEFTLLGGICEASSLQLAKTYYYQRRRRISLSPTLRLAASTYSKLIMLGVATYGGQAFLHLTTEMVEFDRLDFDSRYEPGRGLSQLCLEGNREENSYPCTYNLSNLDMPIQLREQFHLQRNTSSISQISYSPEGFESRNLALLVPLDVPSNIDYRATSIGVSTECSFITSECSMRYASENISDPSTYYTIFNCSTGFYGALGKEPVINNSLTANDVDIPPLGYKPVARLQLGYYIDPGLDLVYNTVGYDLATLYATREPLPDSKLVNPAYLAVAGRIGFIGLGVDFQGNQDVFMGEHTYIEFAMRCKLTTFEVEYSRVNGTLQDVSSNPTNGSVLEIFHGVQFYDLTTSSAFDLQEILAQAGLQPTTKDLARKWEKLFSTKILSVIGSVTTPRSPLLQQARTRMLVAEISWLAIAYLGFCSIIYVLAGLYTIVSARRTDPMERLLGEVLCTPGAGFAAFQSPTNMMRSMRMTKLDDGSRLDQGNDLVDVEGLPGMFQLKIVTPRELGSR
jgi:hypothetical protein